MPEKTKTLLIHFSITLYKICQENKEKSSIKNAVISLYEEFFANQKISFDEAFNFLNKYCSNMDTLPEQMHKYFNNKNELEKFCNQSKKMIFVLNRLILWLIKDVRGKRYVTTEEVGNILSANHQMVLGLIHSGKLPAYKLNNQYRILYDDVILFIEENKYSSINKPTKKQQQESVVSQKSPSQHKNNEPIVYIVEKKEGAKDTKKKEPVENQEDSFSDIIDDNADSNKESGMGVSLANMIQPTKKKEKIAIEL
jgi:excisionase family DNA binding protein